VLGGLFFLGFFGAVVVDVAGVVVGVVVGLVVERGRVVVGDGLALVLVGVVLVGVVLAGVVVVGVVVVGVAPVPVGTETTAPSSGTGWAAR